MYLDNLIITGVIIAIALSVYSLVLARKNTARAEKHIRRMAFHLMLIQENEKARELCRKIRDISPDLCAGLDFLLKEIDGDVKIAEWNSDHPRPDR